MLLHIMQLNCNLWELSWFFYELSIAQYYLSWQNSTHPNSLHPQFFFFGIPLSFEMALGKLNHYSRQSLCFTHQLVQVHVMCNMRVFQFNWGCLAGARGGVRTALDSPLVLVLAQWELIANQHFEVLVEPGLVTRQHSFDLFWPS